MHTGLRHIISIAFLFLGISTLHSQQPSVYRVTRLSFNDAVFSEISPVIVRDGIVFCSDRRFSSVRDRKSFEGNRIYNIYMATGKDTAEFHKPVMLRSERSELFNSGPLCIASDGKSVWFTSEVETGRITRKRTYRNHSGLFTAELNGNELVSLKPFPFNSNEYNIAQPSLSSNGRFLYFASDMPGGEGNSDIYYSELINGNWSKPVNMGPVINGPGIENFPFIHPSGRLYFSSDRPGGPGRLDVYYTSRSADGWYEPVLVAEPVNSPADDFAFVAGEDLQSGFFTSDRRINDDIYRFEIGRASCRERV